MNILGIVTRQNLKKNKSSTIATILGIMLSTAMFCAVTILMASFLSFMIDTTTYYEGNWHGASLGISVENVETIQNSDEIESTSITSLMGYAEIESTNTDKPYIAIQAGDDSFFENMAIHLVDGRLPVDDREIIVPEHLFSSGGIQYKIDDEVKLNVGKRMLSDGKEIILNTELQQDTESIVHTTEKTYIVVGTYKRPCDGVEDYSAAGFTVLTKLNTFPEDGTFSCYYLMKEPKNIYLFQERDDIGTTPKLNSELLLYNGVSSHNTFYKMLYSLAAIVCGLILFGSISLIYNAFSISVSERSKQFGLLSSIGATKKQLKRSVFLEGCYLSIIGIPLGVLLGIVGIGITLKCIGGNFATLASSNIPMTLHVPLWSVLSAVVIAFITIMISALIPARRATKISAIQSIRQSEDIKLTAKNVKSSKLTSKVFGLSGTLAEKYYHRSHKKYRATIISLFMSVVLFVSASAFSMYMTHSVEDGMATQGFDIEFTHVPEDFDKVLPEELIQQISNINEVEKVASVTTEMVTTYVPTEALTDEYKQNYNLYKSSDVTTDEYEIRNLNKNDINNLPENIPIDASAVFVDDIAYSSFVKESGLDESTYLNSTSPVAIMLAPKITYFNSDKDRFENIDIIKSNISKIKINQIAEKEGYYGYSSCLTEDGSAVYMYYPNSEGDTLTVEENEAVIGEKELKVGKNLFESPYFVDRYQSGITLIYPQSAHDVVIGKNSDEQLPTVLYIKAPNHAKAFNKICTILTDTGIPTLRLYDYAHRVETNRKMILIINVFAYGFITLISLIAIANVFNTISTNIYLRKREFATLQSIGMTPKGFNRMLNYECFMYGSRSLITGLPVSILLSWLMYKGIMNGLEISFMLPWKAIVIAVLSVFIVVFISMLFAMRKIKKENTIDALKLETY